MLMRYQAGPLLSVLLAVVGTAVVVSVPSGSIVRVLAADAPTVSVKVGVPSSSEADEKAFRATADEFVKAFNAGDAKTISAQWSADASYIDESGEVFHGATQFRSSTFSCSKSIRGQPSRCLSIRFGSSALIRRSSGELPR